MLQKSSISKTMEVFFQEPTKLQYLLDISRKIKVAHTSVKANLKELVKAGIITEHKEKKGTRVFPTYQANRESRLFRQQKILYNLSSLWESGIITYLEEKLAPKSIVLFGSYARGEDTEESDIDLFIECSKEEVDVTAFEKKLHRKIELHFNKKFESYPKELKNNIINGIVLHGFLEGYA